MIDDERFESVAAQVTALSVVVSALVETLQKSSLLKEAIHEYEQAALSDLPFETGEQKRFRNLVKERLSRFNESL
jgi:hypothetical protein